MRRLQLTRQVIKVLRGARSGKVRAIAKKEQVAQRFAESSLGRAYARQARRQSLTDFERYKVLVLRRKLAKLTRAKPAKKWLTLYLNLTQYLSSIVYTSRERRGKYISSNKCEWYVGIGVNAGAIMRWGLYYSLSWRPRHAQCRWCSASRLWMKGESLLRWCSPNLIQLASRSRWHPKSPDRARRVCCS